LEPAALDEVLSKAEKPFELSRWRGGRYAWVTGAAVIAAR